MDFLHLDLGFLQMRLDLRPPKKPPEPKLCTLCGEVEVQRRGSRCPVCALKWEALKAEARSLGRRRQAPERKQLPPGTVEVLDENGKVIG